jgi:hypothetical protein
MAWKGYGKTISFKVYDIFEIPPEDATHTPYVGDVGTLIQIDMGEGDLTGWANCKLYVQKSDGTETTWTPEIPDDQYLKYTIVVDDFNQRGEFKITPYGEAP